LPGADPTCSGRAGKFAPSALEAADVDLVDEFTKMIVKHRAYSANARVISTADQCSTSWSALAGSRCCQSLVDSRGRHHSFTFVLRRFLSHAVDDRRK
jgi:hypothetical protein